MTKPWDSPTTRRKQRTLPIPLLLYFSSLSHAQTSKRGIGYLGDNHAPDNALLLDSSSPIVWYYNWSPYPPSQLTSPLHTMEFIPLIHGISDAQSASTSAQIASLPASSQHLLSFNEPDGTKDSGGSAIKPEDAAQSYIKNIVPYRDGKSGGGRKWKISHPATTGSPRGLDWLRDFNSSCWKMDPDNGCPLDFVAAHWYGAFDGLASWLDQLDKFYNGNKSEGDTRLGIWVTEMALPQQKADATVQMLNQTLPYLDKLDYVERYAWFGAFREKNANEWTGDGVALFDNHGGLTKLGALYMGSGFKEGQKGTGAGSGVRLSGALCALTLALTVLLVSW